VVRAGAFRLPIVELTASVAQAAIDTGRKNRS
jgi:hypothetical protein